ncbi:hypothetical protein F8388_015742 [Cannabis sativa]|uniref:RNase H type-1 domain-containing protein n=1 Tax=Cannabis sativa TaxID=3483 RepID=A0A7J6E4R3_CANSA|nr:hypothetical protein F8388_015742 [Cannabis sativa]
MAFCRTSEIVNWILHPSPTNFSSSSGDDSLSQFAAYLCFSLWNTRNHVYHSGSSVRSQDVLSNCSKLVNNFCACQLRISKGNLENLAYVAIVVFNKDGKFIDALTAKVSSFSALHAECMALCHAFAMCLKLNCKDANFFSDYLQLVNAIRNFTIPLRTVLGLSRHSRVLGLSQHDVSLSLSQHSVVLRLSWHNVVFGLSQYGTILDLSWHGATFGQSRHGVVLGLSDTMPS